MNTAMEVVLIAGACALAVGLAGFGASWLLRRRSIRWQLSLVALVAVLGGFAGTQVAARRMFISDHDLRVVSVLTGVSGLVALIAALALGQAVSRWSTVLRDAVRSVGDGQPYTGAHHGPSEFRQLADELARAQQRLDESRTRERRIEESRRELVVWVSHDLRTPLAGMRALTEAFEDGLTDDTTYHERIHAEVERMSRMVNDLFELSRINAGVLTVLPEPLALRDVVSDAIAGADAVARARRVRLDGSVDAGLEVLADPAGLSRVASNLIMNAVRHTPAHGVVEIRGRAVPDGVELSVSDGCGGIPESDMARLFDVAWQRVQARTPDPGPGGAGGGLGLSIVKGIVEAHQGEVSVENLDGASGCRFSVRLPAADARVGSDA